LDPKIFWNILPPSGKYTRAAVLHDYLYKTGLFTKQEADLLFKEAMESMGVSEWRVYSMYYGVEVFGFKAWNNHRRK